MHADDESFYKIPDERNLAAQYLLLYEMSLPYGLDLNNQINVDKSATRMTATLKTISSNNLIDLEGRAQQWLLVIRRTSPRQTVVVRLLCLRISANVTLSVC